MPGRKGQHGYYIGKMDALREARGGRCEFNGCGKRSDLEFAHLRPTQVWGRGRGRAERYHDIKKFPDAYALLCVKHHKEQERANRLGEDQRYTSREPGEDDE